MDNKKASYVSDIIPAMNIIVQGFKNTYTKKKLCF